MATKFLDYTGLSHLWGKVKAHVLQNGIFYGTCSTGKTTAEKTTTIAGITELKTGITIAVKFTNTNTASSPTLKVNSLNAKAIKRYGTTAAGTDISTTWNNGAIVTMTYDGIYWVMHDWLNTTYPAMTSAEMHTGTATDAKTITPSRLKSAVEYHAPVTSINSKTGAVSLTASDVGALDQSGILNLFYPVGSYYETSDTTFDPNTSWGGTWVLETEGQVHISGSVSGTYQVSGATTDTSDGGSATVTLTTDEIPAHTHGSKQLKGSATAYSDCGLISGAAYTTGIFSKQATPSLSKYRLKWETHSSGSAELNVDASHEHDSVGLDQAHNNMQPYIIVNRWHRTA